MRITITRKKRRNQLTCWRADGSCESADLGPSLPHHDLAHFVVERKLDLIDGFFGRIARGCSVAQLSQTETIQNSPPEALVAEVLARALQSLSTGACRLDQFAELVNAALLKQRLPPLEISSEQAVDRLEEFRALADRYSALRVGETMELEFPSRGLAGSAIAAEAQDSQGRRITLYSSTNS